MARDAEALPVVTDPSPDEARGRQGRELDRRFELTEAIILAIATVLTAWSAFQATKWSGEQADWYSRASAARTESAKASTLAGQQTTIDVSTFLQWLAAVDNERQTNPNQSLGAGGTYQPSPATLSGFLYARFRSEFKPAVQAWLAQRPLSNPSAAPTPFQLPEYKLASSVQAAKAEAQAEADAATARKANDRSDGYVLVTVLFASVLFFAGISSKMDTFKARMLLLTTAVVMLLGAATFLVSMPRQL